LQAADAALSKEQLEEREAARLAALEAARLKRMKADAAADAAAAGGDDEGDGDGDTAAADLPKGGYAAKRARAKFEAEREDKRQKRRLDASGVVGGGTWA
jgi:hypothetical protein